MKLAIGIINRNLPNMTDQLAERISHLGDIFVLENGSDKDLYSKYANICVEESNGLAWGVNHLLQHCISLGYEYIWINYNDVDIHDPDGFVKWSLATMQQDPLVGVTIVNWGSIWDMSGYEIPRDDDLVLIGAKWNAGGSGHPISFFDDLSFVVSVRALEAISKFNNRLTPFFDSSNYTNHYNVLGPSLALYSSSMKMMMNPEYTATEICETAIENSGVARGYDNEYWKNVKGPEDIDKWINSYFKELQDLHIPNKQKRDIIIQRIVRFADNII